MSTANEQEIVVPGRQARARRRWVADFERTALLVRRFVVERYGEAGADAFHLDARETYQKILRWFGGSKALALRS